MEDQLHTILEVREQIKLELIKVIEFEEKLARISPQRLEMLRPDMLTPYSIEKLSSEFPFLSWNDFFDSALHTTLDEGKLNPGFYLLSLNSFGSLHLCETTQLDLFTPFLHFSEKIILILELKSGHSITQVP